MTELLLLLLGEGEGEGKRALVVALSNEPCRRSRGLPLPPVILLLAVPPMILLFAVTVVPAMLRHFSTVFKWSKISLLVTEGLVRLCFPLDTAPVEQQQEITVS